MCKLPYEPNNPRDWGLVKEKEARKSYQSVAGKQHHKPDLKHKGFQICKQKPFLGACIDDVRSCKCSSDCGFVPVEYKCPWMHKNSDSKEAFAKEIGGILRKDAYYLQKNSSAYQTRCLSCCAEIYRHQVPVQRDLASDFSKIFCDLKDFE